MTIDEAIKLIEHCAKTHARYDRIEIKAALNLGIKALERIKECRLTDYTIIEDYLPGETDQ